MLRWKASNVRRLRIGLCIAMSLRALSALGAGLKVHGQGFMSERTKLSRKMAFRYSFTMLTEVAVIGDSLVCFERQERKMVT